jgi:hypothetical protein
MRDIPARELLEEARAKHAGRSGGLSGRHVVA